MEHVINNIGTANTINRNGEFMNKKQDNVIFGNAVYNRNEKRAYKFIKRAFDIFASLFAIILLSWLFAAIAIAIKIDDGGPVFYVSNRVGLFGKEFRFYKFRSMCVNADEVFEEIKKLNETDGLIFKMKRDPRITRVGRLLRKTSLDELPQLLNILKGDMSFVGPRPPLPREVKNYTDFSMQRLTVIGGLTCYWQISGRSKIDFNGMVKLDCKYIEERSVWTDIKILFLTIPAVIRGDGAY